eukprot:9908478-Prorocentrum_lima.AAC.1
MAWSETPVHWWLITACWSVSSGEAIMSRVRSWRLFLLVWPGLSFGHVPHLCRMWRSWSRR